MYTGPHIIKDGLVFGYDTGYGVADNGTATRFYAGEPTTNILPSPALNGRFTVGNGWQTYNTNQYNGNSDFSIGVVGSVTNNIVTLSSVGRNIRSFDVLNPATTGGGVTAGTNYVIKKISSTTFSLHSYNSSQNGSQGYINPDTGFFKVHDAYANDTRISITASSFPTMWHGAPHLPNSGLIKEIVPNGGKVKGTNSMRFHIYRGDGVADGMAYGVYSPVTAGDIITVSYWAKPTNSLGHGKSLGYSTYFGAGNSAPGFSTNLNSDGEWQLITHTWTASTTVSFYSYFWPGGSTDKWAVDLADMQVEINNGHATPFTLTNRSSTASLIDLKETASIDVSNVSFDSTGQPTFDGSNDQIAIDVDDIVRNANTITIEGIVNATAINAGAPWGILTDHASATDSDGFWWHYNIGGYVYFRVEDATAGEQGTTFAGSVPFVANTYQHVVTVVGDNNVKIYVNGELSKSYTPNFKWDRIDSTKTAYLYLGRTYPNYYLSCAMPVLKMHNKELSATEIKQNFNAYKNRFSI